MAKRKTRASKGPPFGSRPTAGAAVLAPLRSAEPLPPEAASWPLIRAYAPVADVWRATGLGTAGVVRRQPDGRYASVFCTLYLLQHGIEMALGWPDATLQETDERIAALRDMIPPMTESSIEEAAFYAWGAFALNELESDPFPPEVIEQYLSLLPRPAGSLRELRDALIGPGGPTPRASSRSSPGIRCQRTCRRARRLSS